MRARTVRTSFVHFFLLSTLLLFGSVLDARAQIGIPFVSPTTPQVVPLGGSATFNCSFAGPAHGSPYFWLINGFSTITNTGPFSGANTPQLTITGATAALNGIALYCEVTGAGSTTFGTLYVRGFAFQPASQSGALGGSVTFTAQPLTASSPTYQWEISSGFGLWTPLLNGGPYSGVTTQTLTVSLSNTNLHGTQYRVRAVDSLGIQVSDAATLLLNGGPIITTHPLNQSVTTGTSATFAVAASGAPVPTYQWQSSTNGNVWTDVPGGAPYSGETTATLIVSPTSLALSGLWYRAVATNVVGSAPSNSATLTVNVPPSIISHPANQTVTGGASATFACAATGVPAPTYKWQKLSSAVWTDVSNTGGYSGATTATLTVTGATGPLAGQYRCLATNLAGSAPSNAATLDVLLAFTTQPVSKEAAGGTIATFTAVATGSPAPTLQWQVSTNGGVTWTPLTNVAPYSGVTSSTLTATDVRATLSGSLYRCVATNGTSTLTSNTVSLTVLEFTTQPVDQLAAAGATASFTIVTAGTTAPAYQWQLSTDGEQHWTSLTNAAPYSGVNTTQLLITGITVGLNSYRFRCVATSGSLSINSTTGVLRVHAAPAITTQPGGQAVNSGTTATFTVAASGVPAPTFQWQVSTNAGTTWTDLANTAPYSGVTTTTLTVTPAPAGFSSYQYRAVATNQTGAATSSAATLIVRSAPAIVSQPSNQSVTEGASATFTVSVNGVPTPTYKWQVSTSSGLTWSDLPNSANSSGVTTPTLTLTSVQFGMSGYQFRAIVTNDLGTSTTSAATLTVNIAPVVTTHPASQTVVEGTSASFTVVTTGSPAATYQWQVSTDAGVTFTNIANLSPYSGTTTSVLTLSVATAAMTGYRYRVVATNPAGATTSAVATLTVYVLPIITLHPASQTVALASSATFTAAALGAPTPTFQWQTASNDGAVWSVVNDAGPFSGSTTPTLTVTNITAELGGTKYRCVVTNNVGSATTSSATLVLAAIPGQELVQNGDFSSGSSGWLQFEAPDIVSSVVAGVFRFHRANPTTTASGQAVVFQNTGQRVEAGESVAAQFDLGNADGVRKRISVLVVDADFSDLSVCTFWLAAGAPLRTYSMRSHATENWPNASIYFYAASTGTGDYLVDNVSLKTDANGSSTRTECVDPTRPVSGGGTPGLNLVANGDFSGSTIAPWGTFFDLTSRVSGGVFEFGRPGTPGVPAGGILQATGQTMSSGQSMTAAFQLGNTSSVRKRVTVLLHDLDFSDLSACTFWLAPGQPLSNYTIRSFATKAWTNATISFYAATVGPEQWMQLDNVVFQRTPGNTSLGTECFEPGSATVPSFDEQPGAMLIPFTPQFEIRGGFKVATDPMSGATVWQAEATTAGSGVLTWAPIDLTDATSAVLRFESWLSTPTSNASVQVSLDGSHWQTLAQLETSDGWTPVFVDLAPFVGHRIYLRWVLDAAATDAGVEPCFWKVGGAEIIGTAVERPDRPEHRR